MEYQKIIDLLENTPNQPTKFRKKNWVEINDDAHGKYNTNSQIKFKTSMFKSSLCDYSDTYIKELKQSHQYHYQQETQIIMIKEVVFKNCVPFIDCTSEISKSQIDNAKNIDVIMPMYNLIEYSDNYSKTSGSLW